MKLAHQIFLLTLLCLCCRLALGQTAKPEKADLASLAREYSTFKKSEWKKKRDFCIRLMDDRVIYEGTSVAKLRQLFGSDLTIREKTDRWAAGGTVYFQIEGDGGYSQSYIGWRLEFDTDNGELTDYSLTNKSPK
jgi:hypothetical protein